MLKKALVFGWNTIPVTNKKIPISATGMRTYKLALGLLENGVPKVDVAIRSYEPAMGKSADKRIKILKWETDDQVAELANKYDCIIINSNYDASTPYILDKIKDNVVKVVDAFIPFYFEESMRSNVNDEIRQNHVRRLSFLHESFSKADYILIANTNQKLMYLGGFGAVNLLNFDNFRDYKDNFIINFPGVINELIPKKNPYKEYEKQINGRRIVIWFGSTYTWYDIDPLINAYRVNSQLAKETVLFIVGAKNPDFASTPISNQNKITNNSIMFVPWVNFADRLTWLAYADVGVSINKITPENTFSFRNRLIDFIEAGLPIVTNGEDPLGEQIIKLGGGISSETDNLSEQILKSLNSDVNKQLRKGIIQLKKYFDNKTSNQELIKKTSAKTKRVLNKDYIAYTQSDINKLTGTQHIPTRELSKIMAKRLHSSIKYRVVSKRFNKG